MVDAAYDFFIAHAGSDKAKAKALYDRLSALGRKVFLDAESLLPGDPYDAEIPRALRGSRVVVALIGAGPDEAYFLCEEIQSAITRARRKQCRLVPVLLPGGRPHGSGELPYGLNRLHSIDWSDGLAHQLAALPEVEPVDVRPTRIALELRATGDLDHFDRARFEVALALLAGAGFEDLKLSYHRGSVIIRIDGDAAALRALIEALDRPQAGGRSLLQAFDIIDVRCDALEYHRAVSVPQRPELTPVPAQTARLTWLHISDLHFGHGGAGHRAHQRSTLDRLLEDAARMYARLGSPDLVLVTGDVAQSGDPAQYQAAGHWLRDLLKAVAAPPAALAIVPGNHDVARGRVGAGARLWHTAMAGPKGDQTLDDLLASRDDAPTLFQKLEAYAAFAQALGCPLEGPGAPWWTRTVPTGLGDVLLVGLNSALACLDEADRDRVRLGQIQRSEALRAASASRLTLPLVHHPPEWLKDHAALRARLQGLPHLLFTGHVHDSGATVQVALGGGGLLSLSAGAGHAGPDEPPSHGYAWGQLSPAGLEYHPRVWSAKRDEFVADRDHHLSDDGAVREERARLPRPLIEWLRRFDPPPPSPPPDPGPDPVTAETRAAPGSLRATLFRAFQVDRSDQWRYLSEAYADDHAVLILAGHPNQSLPLFVARARHDLERYARRATKVAHVRFRVHDRDDGRTSADAWLKALADALDLTAGSTDAGILAAASAQDLLWVLGPIPSARLVPPDYVGLRDLLGPRLGDLLARHRAAKTGRGLRVLVLVSDDLPADAPDNPPSVGELEQLAWPTMRAVGGSVTAMPRAHFPDWRRDIEPVLKKHLASEATRARVKAKHDQLLREALTTFNEFAQFLEEALSDVTD